MARNTETEIASQWALGVFEKDTGKVQAARDRMKTWNRDNPETPIQITMPQVLRRVREMHKTKEQRFVKAAPKEMRGYAKEM